MIVTVRGRGQWEMWRVGRRRLAWRPRLLGLLSDGGDTSGIVALLNVIPLGILLLNWMAALAATLATWPWRAVTGRWPVVAYPVEDGGGDRFTRVYVQGRSAADTLARQWIAGIERTGAPTESASAAISAGSAPSSAVPTSSGSPSLLSCRCGRRFAAVADMTGAGPGR
jgi:hypothetical protein